MTIQAEILHKISEAFKNQFDHEVSPEELALQPTRKEFEGNYTFVLFPFLRITKMKPEDSGEKIGHYLLENCNTVSGFNVVKGFLNISVNEASWMEVFHKLYEKKTLGQLPPKNQKVMVEFSSPNTNKPLHLGHLRNNFLGFAVSQILQANGYEVIKANLVNDRGIHICKSMVAYQHYGQGETPDSSGLKGDHLAGKYYVIFDKEYKKQIKELMDNGLSEEAAKKGAPLMLEAQEMLRKWEAHDEDTVTLWKTMIMKGLTLLKMGLSFVLLRSRYLSFRKRYRRGGPEKRRVF